MVMFYLYHTLFIVSLLSLALIRPNINEMWFFPWLILVIILNLGWWKLKQSIINAVVWLLFFPICIFFSLVGDPSGISDDNLFQFKIIIAIFIMTWFITGICGNKRIVKPAMGFIDTVMKTVLVYYSNKYVLEHAAEINLSNQETAFVNLLLSPLVLAIIWGKFGVDFSEELKSGIKALPMTVYTNLFSSEFRKFMSEIRETLNK